MCQQIEQEAAYKDTDKEKTAINSAFLMLALAILTLNIVAILGSVLCFIILLKESFYFWKNHCKLIKFAYGASLGATILESAGLLITFVNLNTKINDPLQKQAIINPKTDLAILGVMFFLSGVELIFVAWTYKAIFDMYIEFAAQPMDEENEVVVIKQLGVYAPPFITLESSSCQKQNNF